jgi:hypothetical protein
MVYFKAQKKKIYICGPNNTFYKAVIDVRVQISMR